MSTTILDDQIKPADKAFTHHSDVIRAAFEAKRNNFGGLSRYEIKRVRSCLCAAEYRTWERWKLLEKVVEVFRRKAKKHPEDVEWLRSVPSDELREYYRQGFVVLHNLIEIADVAIKMAK